MQSADGTSRACFAKTSEARVRQHSWSLYAWPSPVEQVGDPQGEMEDRQAWDGRDGRHYWTDGAGTRQKNCSTALRVPHYDCAGSSWAPMVTCFAIVAGRIDEA